MQAPTRQYELTDFLQSELLHSLGSYGMVVKRIDEILSRIASGGQATGVPGSPNAVFPQGTLDGMRDYNESLRTSLHLPAHLREDSSELPSAKNPPQHPYPNESLGGEEERRRWIVDFYSSAIASLEIYGSKPKYSG